MTNYFAHVLGGRPIYKISSIAMIHKKLNISDLEFDQMKNYIE